MLTQVQAAVAAEIGGNIRTLRKAIVPYLSQERLARLADVSNATIYRAERGVGIPEWDTLEQIAQALGCDIFDLLPGSRTGNG